VRGRRLTAPPPRRVARRGHSPEASLRHRRYRRRLRSLPSNHQAARQHTRTAFWPNSVGPLRLSLVGRWKRTCSADASGSACAAGRPRLRPGVPSGLASAHLDQLAAGRIPRSSGQVARKPLSSAGLDESRSRRGVGLGVRAPPAAPTRRATSAPAGALRRGNTSHHVVQHRRMVGRIDPRRAPTEGCPLMIRPPYRCARSCPQLRDPRDLSERDRIKIEPRLQYISRHQRLWATRNRTNRPG
jgi:hypothetical protein